MDAYLSLRNDPTTESFTRPALLCRSHQGFELQVLPAALNEHGVTVKVHMERARRPDDRNDQSST